MIASLKGKVLDKMLGFLVIEVHGLGFKVFVTPDTLSKARKKQNLELFTFLFVRENSLDLYGFLKKEEKELFEQLISVSGIGPKGALGVLAQASPSQIRTSIATNDYSILTKVSGIGKKTAERIVLELRNKIAFIATARGDSARTREELEALEALLALGYREEDARKALSKVDNKIKKIEDKVKEALKLLAR